MNALRRCMKYVGKYRKIQYLLVMFGFASLHLKKHSNNVDVTTQIQTRVKKALAKISPRVRLVELLLNLL